MTGRYLELPRGAALEISHLQMNAEKHLCYWGARAGECAALPNGRLEMVSCIREF